MNGRVKEMIIVGSLNFNITSNNVMHRIGHSVREVESEAGLDIKIHKNKTYPK